MDKRAIRELFPVTRRLTYLNHAAVGSLSVRAYEAMERHARDHRDFGALHWRDWYAEYDRLRETAARMINADAGEIAILKNTSEGLSFVAQGFRWRAGENVVTTGLEFPSNFTPWKRLEDRGIECRVAPTPSVADIAPLIDAHTRIVTVSAVAFHNGFAADLDAIGRLCSAHNVLFCVDAIQAVGALPVDVRRSNIAFLAADGHKWMCNTEGTAMFFAAAAHRDVLDVLEMGWTNVERRGRFIDSPTDLVADARRFEAGSLNTNGIYGLRAALELLMEIGLDEIGAEVVRLATLLADRAEAAGFRIGSPRPIASGIIGIFPRQPGGRELLRLHGELEKQGIVCAPREGMLRFSPHFYNSDDEMERVVAALRTIGA